MESILSKELCFANQLFDTKEDALSFMADQMYKLGYVSESYKENVIKREEEYPTGLNSEEPKVAIPHTDYHLVGKSTLCVMTLKEGLLFQSMEDPDEEILVDIIIMMALNNPDKQLEMLQKVMRLIQNNSLKEEMLECEENDDLFEIITSFLKI